MRPNMSPASTVAQLLPAAIPKARDTRLLLFVIRRLGAYGLDDAHAATAFVTAFGAVFRRPLVLARTFMHELAATATLPVTIAPCCCQRMTLAESTLLTAIGRSETDPARANILLADLLGIRTADALLASATALAAAFADAGRPIEG